MSSSDPDNRSRNNQIVLDENRRNKQKPLDFDGFNKSSGETDVERDLPIPPIAIARGSPHTEKIGSQRPAAEEHNRMIALQEGRQYHADSSKNSISRVESNRLYAEIRGQLYSPDAFSLPRGTLTMGKMRQNHFRKLMQLRKSLEKRCVSLGRAVGHWSADNFVDDVLRRDRIRGLTPRSKYFKRAIRGNIQEGADVPGKHKASRIKEKPFNPAAQKKRSRRAISRNRKGVVPKHGNSALSGDLCQESGKRSTSNGQITRKKPERMSYSKADNKIRNTEDSESELSSDEYEQYGHEARNDEEFSDEFSREQDNSDDSRDDGENDAGIHEDDHLPHKSEEETELFHLREQILQLRRETSMDDLSAFEKNGGIEHNLVRRAKQKPRKRTHRDGNGTSETLNLKPKKKSKRRYQ